MKAQLRPLGTLFHIAAGNAQGLPALSVLEGLVTGNVNILKLPRADDGLTLEIFRQLIKAEPALKSYVYIFDTPSSDIQAMQKMAQSADGIVTWGGDEAVKAVRTLAPAGAKLIEWGHKLGFAYISGYEDKNRELSELAVHIISTGQRLCSSCQTIFINTTSRDELEGFCSDFLPFLERATAETPEDIGETASRTLINYTAELEAAMGVKAAGMFCGKYCSLTVSDGSSLELSPMGNNCLVKAMPEKDIVPALRPFKGYLQTAGLICSRENRERLTDALMRAGVCRIMRAGNMSADIIGGCHDGEYGLRRFMRVVNTEI